MLPSDLTGTMTLRGGELAFRPGPVFTNVLLADEINRTPPKTQAALLEAMQERQVTVDGDARTRSPEPFLVVATQNPIEYEGTYPLPEAQLDRFLRQGRRSATPTSSEERGARACAHRGVRPADPRATCAPSSTSSELARSARRRRRRDRRHRDEVVDYVVAIVRAHPRAPERRARARARAPPCTCSPRRRRAPGSPGAASSPPTTSRRGARVLRTGWC